MASVKLCPKSDQDLGKCTQEHDETIYQGILSTQIKLVKGFSLMTSAIGMSCQPLLFYHMQNGANTAIAIGAGAFLSFFTFATPLLIHTISKKYVTELNYNKLEDTYTAITYSLFLRRKEVKSPFFDVKSRVGLGPRVFENPRLPKGLFPPNIFLILYGFQMFFSDQVQITRCSSH